MLLIFVFFLAGFLASPSCWNGGELVGSECECPVTFENQPPSPGRCDKKSCSGNGRLTINNECECDDGWSGTDCEFCGNNDVCVDYFYDIKADFTSENVICVENSIFSYENMRIVCDVTDDNMAYNIGPIATFQCDGVGYTTELEDDAKKECYLQSWDYNTYNNTDNYLGQVAWCTFTGCEAELTIDETIIYSCETSACHTIYDVSPYKDLMDNSWKYPAIIYDLEPAISGSASVECRNDGVCTFSQEQLVFDFDMQCRGSECTTDDFPIIFPEESMDPTSYIATVFGIICLVAICLFCLIVLDCCLISWTLSEKEKMMDYDKAGGVLEFTDVHYYVNVFKDGGCYKARKEILRGISFKIDKGTLVAVMGATGAGKTTLLDILAKRNKTGVIRGSIKFNYSDRGWNFRRLTGYVVQDDYLMGTMTVRECIQFSADLRLPVTFCSSMKRKLVDDVMKKLDIYKIANRKIGDKMTRGVSGGERKRVSVALELVVNPHLLFLDEPTSGLDASTAHELVVVLKRLTLQEGRTIVMSIHQPRAKIFRLMDTLILLSAGKLIYGGRSASVVSEFERLYGKKFPGGTENPADWVLDLVCQEEKKRQREEEKMDREFEFNAGSPVVYNPQRRGLKEKLRIRKEEFRRKDAEFYTKNKPDEGYFKDVVSRITSGGSGDGVGLEFLENNNNNNNNNIQEEEIELKEMGVVEIEVEEEEQEGEGENEENEENKENVIDMSIPVEELEEGGEEAGNENESSSSSSSDNDEEGDENKLLLENKESIKKDMEEEEKEEEDFSGGAKSPIDEVEEEAREENITIQPENNVIDDITEEEEEEEIARARAKEGLGNSTETIPKRIINKGRRYFYEGVLFPKRIRIRRHKEVEKRRLEGIEISKVGNDEEENVESEGDYFYDYVPDPDTSIPCSLKLGDEGLTISFEDEDNNFVSTTNSINNNNNNNNGNNGHEKSMFSEYINYRNVTDINTLNPQYNELYFDIFERKEKKRKLKKKNEEEREDEKNRVFILQIEWRNKYFIAFKTPEISNAFYNEVNLVLYKELKVLLPKDFKIKKSHKKKKNKKNKKFIMERTTEAEFDEVGNIIIPKQDIKVYTTNSPPLIPFSTPFSHQIMVLSFRSLKHFMRNTYLVPMHIGSSLVLGLLMGLIYWDSELNFSGAQNRYGVMFFMCAIMSFTAMSGLEVFIKERPIFMRERANGYYYPFIYFFVKVFFDLIPLRVIPPLFMGGVCYYMVGLNPPFENYAAFLGLIVLFNVLSGVMCIFIATVSHSVAFANIAATVMILMSSVFGGFLVNRSAMPDWISWLRYFSYWNYVYELLMVNEFQIRYITVSDEVGFSNGIKLTGVAVLDLFGMSQDNVLVNVIVAMIFVVMGILVSGLYLQFRVKERK